VSLTHLSRQNALNQSRVEEAYLEVPKGGSRNPEALREGIWEVRVCISEVGALILAFSILQTDVRQRSNVAKEVKIWLFFI